MSRTIALFMVAVLLTTATRAPAQEGELGVTFDVTYVSRYIYRGFDCYGQNHSGIQSSLDLDLFGSGFGVKVAGFRANGSGFENNEKIDYLLYYYNSLFGGERYATNYKVTWTYHNFPDGPRNICDEQDVEAALAWPAILGGGLVPSYTIARGWPAESNAVNRENGGWAHIFGLGKDVVLKGFLPGNSTQVLHLIAVAIYNDGIGPRGDAVANDWSHAVFGASTDFNVAENLTFTPGFYYQSSWEDSVNTQDEYWTRLSMTYKF